MVNKKFLLRMLVLTLVFGMMVVGCEDESTTNGSGTGTSNGGSSGSSLGLDGTWYSTGNVYKYYFNNGNYEWTYNGNPYRKGTYTTTTDSMTMTVTHIGSYNLSSLTWLNQSTWYSKNEFKTAYLNYYREQYREAYEPTRQSYNELYASYVSAYGTSQANQYFQQAFGTTNVDSYINSQIETAVAQLETSIDSSVNSLFPSTTTVAYSLSGNTLYVGGVALTRG